MSEFGWPEAMNQIQKYMVRIEVPDSYGSGFLIAYLTKEQGRLAVIATANHVVAHANKWREHIRLVHHDTGKDVLLSPTELGIEFHENHDIALIIVRAESLPFPEDTPPMPEPSVVLHSGWPVGWAGFPNMVPNNLCFFRGYISSPYSQGHYLVDGVAINGVSGGPAFVIQDGKAMVIGLVSAYIPNLATGQSMPGMAVIQNIWPVMEYFKARKKEQEQQEKKDQKP